jgi:hypothetical protein
MNDVSSPASKTERVRFALGLGAIMFAACALLVFLGSRDTRAQADQDTYHLRAILTFAKEWPAFHFDDYNSSTTPAYHLVMATVARFVTEDVRALRVVGVLFAVGLVMALAIHMSRRTPPWTAVALCLPVMCSMYVLSSGAWLLPDDAGWWALLASLLIALRPLSTQGAYVAAGVSFAVLVATRQSHVWMAAVFLLAAWFGPADISAEPTRVRVRRCLNMGLALMPGMLLLGWFVWRWNGLMPPSMAAEIERGWQPASRGIHIKGPNFAVPATVLAVTGAAAIFYLGFFLRRRISWLATGCGAVAGLLAGVLPVTSYSNGVRSSGVWNLVRILPTYADRSVLIIVLSTLGGAMIGIMLGRLPRRDALLWLMCWAGFVAAQTVNPSAFQRYYEPFVLIALALTVARIAQSSPNLPPPKWAPIGPVILAAGLALVSARTFLS